jgi:hypothetical protein
VVTSGYVVCSFGTEATSELVVEGTVLGSQAGDLFSVNMELLPEGPGTCRLVPWSATGRRGIWSPVALHGGA